MTAKSSRRHEDEAAEPGIGAEAAYARALKLLARREHSVQELRGKLVARGVEPPVVEQVLDRLGGDGLLDERRFVEAFVRNRVERGYGPLKIHADLLARGVEDGMAGHETDWVAVARRVRAKRFGVVQPASYAERVRQMRFLRQRGFESDQIGAAFGPVDD